MLSPPQVSKTLYCKACFLGKSLETGGTCTAKHNPPMCVVQDAILDGNAVIRHAAIFKLKHPKGSAEENSFLDALKKLKNIPGVENFEIAKEISPKNDFDYAVSMTFSSEVHYQEYNDHPDHVAFVKGRWLPEVMNFMEHDTISMA
jgi:heme-degrading monooxygenase HmoA